MGNFIKLMKVIWSVIKPVFKVPKYNRLKKAGKIEEADAYAASIGVNWGKEVIDITGSTVEAEGLENVPKEGACVFIGNHQSYLDIPTLMGTIGRPVGFVAKAELKKVPLLSSWMKILYCTFLVRKSPHQAVKAMQEGIENVKAGHPLAIFPEGTRSKGGPVKEFHAGSFKLAFKAQVPIVPITFDGTYKVYEETGKITPAKIRLVVHPSIPTEGLDKAAQMALVDKVRETIVSGLVSSEKL